MLALFIQCPLYPRKQTSGGAFGMSDKSNSGHYPKIASIFTLSYEVKPAEKGYEQTSADWHALRSQI
jgi:hypothetical protein